MTVVPFFIFMGQILFYAGLSRKLYDAAYAWLGHYEDGLATRTVALPEMKRFKYRGELPTGW